jgi:hypothetical protein
MWEDDLGDCDETIHVRLHEGIDEFDRHLRGRNYIDCEVYPLTLTDDDIENIINGSCGDYEEALSTEWINTGNEEDDYDNWLPANYDHNLALDHPNDTYDRWLAYVVKRAEQAGYRPQVICDLIPRSNLGTSYACVGTPASKKN